MIDALTPTLTADAYDACLAMGTEKGAGKGEPNVVLFGVGMKDSIKVEAALREAIAKKLKPEDRDKVTLDLDRGPDGTAIHRVTLDAKNLKPEEFGEPLMFLAFPDGAALAAVGGNGLAVLKRALGRSRRRPPRRAPAGPQVGLDFSAVRFSRIHSAENGNSFREAARRLPERGFGPVQNQGPDQGRPDPRVIRARLVIEADLPALGFLVKANVIQQKDKAAKAP